jgi:hypothetical protein
MELLDHAVKVTALGEGGITSDRAIPLGARMTHSTHISALDPIRTPESNHAGVDVRATLAAYRDDKGNLFSEVKNVKTGKIDYIKAGDLNKYVLAFPNQNLKGDVKAFVDGDKTEYLGQEFLEDEAIIGFKFYGISRDFRKAYSEMEGLEPDEEGGSKTKVYHTDYTRQVTLSLMKKIAKRRIVDEFNRREDQTGKESILTSIDAAATIWDLNILREDLLGVEMPLYQAQEMGLLNENGIRIVPVDYSKGF